MARSRSRSSSDSSRSPSPSRDRGRSSRHKSHKDSKSRHRSRSRDRKKDRKRSSSRRRDSRDRRDRKDRHKERRRSRSRDRDSKDSKESRSKDSKESKEKEPEPPKKEEATVPAPAPAPVPTASEVKEDEAAIQKRERMEAWRRKREEDQRLQQQQQQQQQQEEEAAMEVVPSLEDISAPVSRAPSVVKPKEDGGEAMDQEMSEEPTPKGITEQPESAEAQPKWSLEDDDEDDEEEDTNGPANDDDDDFAKFAPKNKLKADDKDDDGFVFGGSLVGKGKGIALPGKLAAPPVAEKQVQATKEEDEDDEIDPLDAFMVDVTKEVQHLTKAPEAPTTQGGSAKAAASAPAPAAPARDLSLEDEEDEDTNPKNKPLTEEELLNLAQQKNKKKELGLTDHSTIDYEAFRKVFYIETPEIAKLTPEEVKKLREELDGIKIRGNNCPKPIKNWAQAGLNMKIQDILKKLGFEGPTPIQAQAIPAIMSGRDVIGIAKTGSGKTLAFLLPMFRHIMDQRPIEDGEGPIGLVLTPTRELAMQIFGEAKKFTKTLKLRPVCAYGGSAIKDQIADLKRGAEIVVCTPGRMIDLLMANQGRVTNLQRVTYMVMDEADRMFDMGFEPQVMKIVNNTRPDRQTVLFSATFPRQMEALARRVLENPLEILVGGRSVVSDTVTQFVEVIEEDAKFFKLLEVMGRYYDPDKRILIFVDTQDAADNLFRDVVGKGYPCLSLHGGKDQMDRDQILEDFKTGDCPVLVATSVAARGLDVKQLHLVINYEVPNHLEDYVHRCGRTGRAGALGVAYTFISPEQDKFAGDIIKALKESKQQVPPQLQQLWDDFSAKVKQGNASFHSSGFGGRGLDRIENDRDATKKAQKKSLGIEETEEQQTEVDENGDLVSITPKVTVIKPAAQPPKPAPVPTPTTSIVPTPANSTTPAVPSPTTGTPVPGTPAAGATPQATPASTNTGAAAKLNPQSLQEALKAAKNKAAAVSANLQPAKAVNFAELFASMKPAATKPTKAVAEVEINDYPPQAKFKVTHKENISRISDFSGAAITTRGTFFAPGQIPKEGERKLYLLVEGPSPAHVEKAVTEIKMMLSESTLNFIEKK